MPTLLLQLKGPLQSWAAEDGYTHRNTGSLPTKSGVIGLVASALGRARGSDISDLAALRFGVQPVHTGPRLTDFQTMGKRADGKPNPLETKEYLQDSTFTVGLESTDLRLLIRIGAAIQHPVYMPYLGRRACPPVRPYPSRTGRQAVGTGVQRQGTGARRNHRWHGSTLGSASQQPSIPGTLLQCY